MGIKGQLTPQTFVEKSRILGHQFNQIQQRFAQKVNKLNDKYVKQFCKNYKPGQVIELPEPKDGFTHFRIEKITPQINIVDGASEGKQNLEITYLFGGFYLGEGKEETKGTIQPKVKNDTPEKRTETAD